MKTDSHDRSCGLSSHTEKMITPYLPDHSEIRISEQYPEMDLTEELSCSIISRDGRTENPADTILAEHVIDVFVNEQLTMKLICLPQFLAELVLGRLFTEGIITKGSDVDTLYICEHGKRARVYLKNSVSAPPKRDSGSFIELTPSCCTGNRILNDYFVGQKDLQPVVPIPWHASWIFALADRFADGMPLHSQTWCTHSCFLACREQLLFQCEDLGRHNALDKTIGYAIRNGIDLKQCMIYSSGRIPTDMAVKVIRAGIPILASKASPTREAVLLAREYGLTLITGARRDRIKLFAGEPPVPE